MRRVVFVVVSVLLVCAPIARGWSWPVGGEVTRPFAYDRSTPYAGAASTAASTSQARPGRRSRRQRPERSPSRAASRRADAR